MSEKGPPWEEEVSENLRGKYGYRDARTEIVINLPFPFSAIKKTVSLTVAPADLLRLKAAVDKAVAWAGLPDFQRERDGAP